MDVLYEEIETSKVKYISFIGDASSHRFDLAIINSTRFYGKFIVLDIQSRKNDIIGADDLDDHLYLKHSFQLSDEAAMDLHEFLIQYTG